MQFYRTTGILNIPVGCKLILDEIQIRDRVMNLSVKEKGKCEVKSPIQFKAGEIIGIKEPTKIMLKVLKEIEEKKNGNKS